MPNGKRRIRLSVDDSVKATERRQEDSPAVPATFELRTCQLLLQLLPVLQRPMKHGEVLHIMSEIRHVLGCEGLV